MKRFIKFLNCTEGKNSDNPTELTRKDIDNALRTLLNCACCNIYEKEYGGAPLRCKFYGFITPEAAEIVFKHIESFMHVSYYQDKINVEPDEFGRIGHLILIPSIYYLPLQIDYKLSKNGQSIYGIPIIKKCETGSAEILILTYTLPDQQDIE